MVNRGEEKVRVHMNVVPSGTRTNARFNPEVVGSIPTEVKIIFLCLVWFPVSLY